MVTLIPPGSSFCNQCGSKLTSKSNTDIVKGTLRDARNKPKSEDGLIKHDFVECIMPQNNAKINIPSNWTKMEYYDPNYPQQVMFKSPLENPQDPFYENLAVTYSHIPLGTTLDNMVKIEIDTLKRDNIGFVLIESLRTTLSAIPAQQLLWVEQGFKKLGIIAVKGDREYIILYTAKPEKFDKFLPLVEQCISSFSFLG